MHQFDLKNKTAIITGGAQGVGKSTTTTVVISCLAIVILDYILAALLL